MLTEIFIENKRLDVSAEISSLLTFSIDDVKDFGARSGAFSKTIILPGTSNNNFLFGHIFDARVSNPYDDTTDNVGINFNAATQAACIIFQNHIQVFKGTLRLLEIVILDGIPEYEVAVFGELGGLVAAMGAKKLEDLDFSEYNHAYTVANFQSSWDNAGGSGYYYPLIDIGGVSSNKVDYSFRAFRPALYVKEYIDKIFTAAGYRYESALMDTDRFKRLIIPFCEAKMKAASTVYLDVEADGTQVITTTAFPNGIVDFPVTNTLGNFIAAGGSYAGGFDYDDPLTITGNISVNVSGVCTINSGTNASVALFQRRGSTNTILTSLALPVGVGVPFNVTLNAVTDIEENDIIFVQLIYAVVSVSILYGSLIITPDAEEAVELTYGDDVEMNLTLPRNILQKDFLSSVIRLFNLYLYEDANQVKKIFLKPYVDFYDTNVSGVVDWTYKMDRSKAIRLKPMSELNARYYNFKFKQDGDYYNDLYRKKYTETYGDYIYDSLFEFADEKKDIELIFSPTVLVGYTAADKIVSSFYKKNAGVEEKTDVNIRILQSKKITGVAAWDIETEAGVDLASNLTVYGYAGHYDDPDAPANDIHFGIPRELFFTLVSGSINVTQFNVYWSPYMAEITDKDSKLLIAYFKLLNSDIYSLDFSKPIYIDGSYWRLNKIVDWNASEPDVCVCELLKIIYLIY